MRFLASFAVQPICRHQSWTDAKQHLLYIPPPISLAREAKSTGAMRAPQARS